MELSEEPIDDALHALQQRLAVGDVDALTELYSHHRERLWKMVQFRINRSLAGRVDPDDILQEAYLDAVQRISHYRNETTGSAFLWLRMIVNQTIVDVHRRHLGAQMRDARRDVSLDARSFSEQVSGSLATLLVGHLTSPSQAAMRAEVSDQLTQAIAQMDPVDQEILALRHFEELTNQEVADALQIQRNAASMRYIRAIKRLTQILANGQSN